MTDCIQEKNFEQKSLGLLAWEMKFKLEIHHSQNCWVLKNLFQPLIKWKTTNAPKKETWKVHYL